MKRMGADSWLRLVELIVVDNADYDFDDSELEDIEDLDEPVEW